MNLAVNGPGRFDRDVKTVEPELLGECRNLAGKHRFATRQNHMLNTASSSHLNQFVNAEIVPFRVP